MHRKSKDDRPDLQSRKRGFSLVMVMSIGLIGLMGSMAISSMLFDGKRYSDRTLIQAQVLQNAETVANYAVRKIYQDRPAPGAIAIPKELKGLADDVSQTIITKDSNGFDTSVLNIPNMSLTVNLPEIRQITVRSQLNGVKRKIVLTIAIFDKSYLTTGNGSGSNSPNTVLANALRANGKLTLKNVSLIDPNPNYQIPFLVSNSQLNVENSSLEIPGSVYVYNPNPENGPTLNLNKDTTIDGNLSFNGNTANFTPKPDTASDGNVLGDGLANNGNGIITNDLAGGMPNPYLPVQTASSIALMNTTVMYANNGSAQTPIRVINEVSNLGPSGSIAQAPSLGPAYAQSIQAPINQFNINSGSYISDSLTLRPSDVMNLQGDSTFYFQNTASNISIEGNINTANGQLQIFYGGNHDINIDLGKLGSDSFKGQIYAPNANVNVNLQGKTFQGSITANALNVQGKDGSSNGSGGNFKFVPANVTLLAKPVQRISWVESNTW